MIWDVQKDGYLICGGPLLWRDVYIEVIGEHDDAVGAKANSPGRVEVIVMCN